MARKNLLEGLGDIGLSDADATVSPYPARGASKTMIRSLDELAKQADSFLEGEAIVELDPALIDSSFVTDRLGDDVEEFDDLLEAIKARGQDTPILVRPHSAIDGRYQIVFGHRRVRVAGDLGRKVRAVVKTIDDRTHVIAQGQENSARSNLSFIERALFAKRLGDLGYDREVIATALAANPASLSKMLTVTDRIPASVITSIGSAPSIGRERWVELSLLVGKSSNIDQVETTVGTLEFAALASDERFAMLFAALNRSGRPVKKTEPSIGKARWQPTDKAISAEIRNTGKVFSLSMKARNAGRFGEFLSENLDSLYEQFLQEEKRQGD